MHRAPSPRSRKPPTQSRQRRLNAAVRRVVVTPTFAAGLGIVIAAVLAYPVSQLSLQIARPKSQQCRIRGCGPVIRGGVGSLASAPVHRMVTPTSPSHARSGGLPSPAPARVPVLTYQTMHDWKGNVVVGLAVAPVAPVPSGGWKLRISYPSSRILGVWGGHWQPDGDHAAVITAYGGLGGRYGGSAIRVFVTLSGPPGPPASCSFDGQICRVVDGNVGAPAGASRTLGSSR